MWVTFAYVFESFFFCLLSNGNRFPELCVILQEKLTKNLLLLFNIARKLFTFVASISYIIKFNFLEIKKAFIRHIQMFA